MLKELRKQHVENISRGINSNLEDVLNQNLSKMTKNEIQALLVENEIYFAENSAKNELIERAYTYERNCLGYQILKTPDIENESIADFYSRLLKEFY